jgi:integrase
MEAPKIGALLSSWEARRPESVAFIYLLVLSGARPEEIARARPEWVRSLPIGGRLDLPDSKTGAKPVYLPPQVMDLLARLPKGDTLTGIRSPKALWEIIRVEAGCPDLRLYDLRHTFASAALQAGYTLEQIGELLGHKNTQTTKRYAHLIDGHAQRAAADTANVLEGMMRPALTSRAST